jgi:hypothetical protein
MMVVTQVKAQLSDPVTQQEIHDKSVQACAVLPEGAMRDTCMGFVEQWGERKGLVGVGWRVGRE